MAAEAVMDCCVLAWLSLKVSFLWRNQCYASRIRLIYIDTAVH
jgi:hypothetical protein